jgi:hypothetical protein
MHTLTTASVFVYSRTPAGGYAYARTLTVPAEVDLEYFSFGQQFLQLPNGTLFVWDGNHDVIELESGKKHPRPEGYDTTESNFGKMMGQSADGRTYFIFAVSAPAGEVSSLLLRNNQLHTCILDSRASL